MNPSKLDFVREGEVLLTAGSGVKADKLTLIIDGDEILYDRSKQPFLWRPIMDYAQWSFSRLQDLKRTLEEMIAAGEAHQGTLKEVKAEIEARKWSVVGLLKGRFLTEYGRFREKDAAENHAKNIGPKVPFYDSE